MNIKTFTQDKGSVYLNLSVAFLLILVLYFWYFKNFLPEHRQAISDATEQIQVVRNLDEDGLNNQPEALTHTELNNYKIQTFKKLVPNLAYLIEKTETETDEDREHKEGLLLDVLKKDDTKKRYLDWMNQVFINEEVSTYVSDQMREIGEVIPVFLSHNPNIQNTKNIDSKVTLGSLIFYVQTAILEQYNVGLTEGEIGITDIKFDPEVPQIGYYTISADLEGVDYQNVLDIFQFVHHTGNIIFGEGDEENAPEIEHISPITDRVQKRASNNKDGKSSLSNLLISLEDISIRPVQIESEEGVNTNIQEGDPYFGIGEDADFSKWSTTLNFVFYIRGASALQMDIIEEQIRHIIEGEKQGDIEKITQDALTDETDLPLEKRIKEQADRCNIQDCTPLQEQESAYLRDLEKSLKTVAASYRALVLSREKWSTTEETNDIQEIQKRMNILESLQSIEAKLEQSATRFNS